MLMRWRHLAHSTLLAVAACLALTSFQADAENLDPQTAASSDNTTSYRLGSGLKIPGTGLTLGGYSTGSFDNLKQAHSRFALDNLSLFVWWEGEGRWKFFSELDYEFLLNSHFTSEQVTSEGREDRYLALERIYFDYALTDTTTIRAGKFLTPIGRWNLIHANPLVWTSSRPLITTNTFPDNVTGLMVSGTLSTLGNGIEYSLYGSHGHEIRPNPDQDTFSDALGGHITLALPAGSQLGFSLAEFEQENTPNERKYLVGTDFVWARNRYEVSTEWVYRFSNGGSGRDEKGGFVQVVAPLTEKLYAVGRHEVIREAQEKATTQLFLIGLNYRYTPAIVFKAEWIGSKNNSIGAPAGFLSSVSILF